MPQTQAFYEDGTPIPEEKLGEALQRGEALFEKGAAVKMRDAYGKLVDVAAADINQAMAAGFGLETSAGLEREQARQAHGEGLGQTALAAVEGAGRGLTFGLSDAVATELGGEEYRKAAQARQEFNPVASGAGEVVGAIAPILASGGTGAAAKGIATAGALPRGAAAVGRGVEGAVMGGLGAAGYTGATALGRAGARAASLGAAGAAEGALYGAGKALSDTALEGSELTAEKILSSMGTGALYGGAAGAFLGGAGSLISSGVGGAAGKEAVRDYAQTLRDESVLKSLGAQKCDLNKLAGRKSADAAERKMANIANDVFEFKFKDGSQLFKGARAPAEMADDMGRAVREAGDDLRALKGQLDEAVKADPSLAPDVSSWLKKVDNTVLAEMRRSTSPTIRKRAAAVDSELELIRQRLAPPKTADELTELGVSRRSGETLEAIVPEQAPVTFLEADEMRRHLREAFQPPGGAAIPEHKAALERAERMFAETITESGEAALKKLGQDRAVWRETNRKLSSLIDASEIVTKHSRDFGNRAISPSDYAMGIASGLGALASGNVGALAVGAAGAVAHKLIRERGRSVVAHMADRVLKFQTKLDDAAQAIAQTTQAPKRIAAPVVAQAADVKQRYASAADAVATMANDPRAALQVTSRLTENYADAYPGMAMSVQKAVIEDATYLAGLLPKTLTRADASLTPTAVRPRVPAPEMRKFLAAVEALDNPSAVIDMLVEGRMPAREAIEALKARRPQIFEDLRSKVVVACLKRDSELAYPRRILLSLVFDFRGDQSMDPMFMGAVQESFVPPQLPPPPPSAAGMKLSQTQSAQMELTQGA
jgi:hypothetical protein